MKTSPPSSSPRAGFALILVMITVIALTALVASFAISMNTEVRLARNADYDQELEWLGRSGVELAKFALANKCPEQRNIDALNQFWAGGTSPCSNEIPQISLRDVQLGHGRFSVTIIDMERKWDINLAANLQRPQRDVLQKALGIVGVTDAGLASTIEDSIIDWCNPIPNPSASGAKSDYYMSLKPPYWCKGGPIDDLTELLDIKGISPEIYWGSISSNHPVSAYQQHGGGAFGQPVSGPAGSFRNKDEPFYPVGLEQLFSPLGGKLNVNTASALTLQLIPGVDEPTAQRAIQLRAGPDGIDGTDDDMPFQSIGEFISNLPGGGPVESGTPPRPAKQWPRPQPHAGHSRLHRRPQLRFRREGGCRNQQLQKDLSRRRQPLRRRRGATQMREVLLGVGRADSPASLCRAAFTSTQVPRWAQV